MLNCNNGLDNRPLKLEHGCEIISNINYERNYLLVS